MPIWAQVKQENRQPKPAKKPDIRWFGQSENLFTCGCLLARHFNLLATAHNGSKDQPLQCVDQAVIRVDETGLQVDQGFVDSFAGSVDKSVKRLSATVASHST